MSIRTSPCDWPVSYTGCGPCIALENADPDDKVMFETMATDFLWLWTGRVFGLCTATVRPCGPQCWEGVNTFNGWRGGVRYGPSGHASPALVNGVWYNVGCGNCGDPCGCGDGGSIRLLGPVDSIVSVTVDGDVVPPNSYSVLNHSFLSKTSGEWPQCGVEVSYKRGIEVPVGGQVAAGVLACEFAKSASHDNTCALPQRIQNISRQGVTVTLLDDFKSLTEGSTGIWLIDSWVQSSTKTKTRPAVRSVDYRPHRSVT